MHSYKRYDNYLVFIIAFLTCTSFIGTYPIYILDEARNSEAAREMLANLNFIVPYFNGDLRTDKPPLHYYFMIVGYKIFGVNALGARFFSGVFGALTLLVNYRAAKKYLNTPVAIISTIVLLSSLFFIQEFHLAVPDPYLIFFIVYALLSFFDFLQNQKLKYLILAYVAVALGVLTKGPIAIALPGMAVFIFFLIKKELTLSTIFKLKPLLGIGLIALIAIPWYYLVHIRTEGKWTQGFFFDHNLSRFGSEMEGHGGLFIITPLFVILGLLPFSVFIIQAFAYAWKARKQNNFILFAFIFSFTTVLFFSISSTKLPNYPMPCYPFIALIIGNYLYAVYSGKLPTKSITWGLYVLLAISILLPILGFYALSLEAHLLKVRTYSLLLLVITLTVGYGVYQYHKKDFKRAFFSIAGGWTFTGLLLFGIIYPKLTSVSPVAKAREIIQEDNELIAFKRFDSAFPINYARTITVFDSAELLSAYLNENPNTLVITNSKKQEDLEKLNGLNLLLEQKALFENHVTRIYSFTKKHPPKL